MTIDELREKYGKPFVKNYQWTDEYVLWLEGNLMKLLEQVEENEDRLYWLECLENAGVDNWLGRDYAYEMYKDEP